MFGTVWQKWIKRLSGPTRPIRGPKASRRVDRRLQVESLEDRVTPALSVTVVAGTGTLDAFLADGVLTTAEGGSTDGTLGAGALAGVAGTTNLSVAALGTIQFSQGSLLTLQTSAGRTASFTAQGGALTINTGSGLSTSGANLTLSGRDGLTLGDAVATNGGAFIGNADANGDGNGDYGQSATLTTGGGAVTISAADVILAGTISTSGVVGIQTSFVGRPIDLASAVPAGNALSLNSSEIAAISAGTLRIGTGTSGGITVGGPVTPTATTLALINGSGGISEPGGSIAVANLRVTSGGAVALTGSNNVGTLSGSGAAGFAFAQAAGLPLTIGTADLVSGLSAANGDIALSADNLDVLQAINAGAKIVTLAPVSPTQIIDLGGVDGAGVLGVSDAELNRITGGTLRIGSSANTGGITISSTVTTHAGYSTLSLITGGPISQSAPIAVTKLAVQAGGPVSLTNSANDVATLAAQATAGGSLAYTDANAVSIGTVDGVTGLSAPGSTVTLTAGATTQAAGAAVTADTLALLGTGPFTLTDPGNTVNNFSAAATNGVNFVNSGSLIVTSALTTNSPITIRTVDGDLTIGGAINSGTADITLTAGGSDRLLDTSAGSVTNAGGRTIDLRADRIAIGTLASTLQAAGSGVVILEPTSSDRPTALDISGTDPFGILTISQSELNAITAGVVRVKAGTSATSDLTTQATITNPATWTTLRLIAGGNIGQAGASTLTVPNLAAQAGGDVLLTNSNTVSVLAGSAGGVFRFIDTGNLTVGTVDGVNGISDPSLTGDVTLTVNAVGGLLTVSQPISTGGSMVSLTADDMAINAAVSAGATGTVVLTPLTPSRTMNLGGGGATLGLTDAELDRVTASVLQLGGGLPQFTGNVTVTGPITQASSGYTSLLINTTGSVTSGGGSLAGTNLAILAGTGIGASGTPLATQVLNLAFQNGSGLVNVSNTGGLTINAVAGVTPSFNNGVAGTTLATTGGPLTFAVNTSSNGTLTATAGDTGAVGDNLTVNSGVTVSAGPAAALILRAGDDIILQPNSIVSAGGAVTLIAGFGDLDGRGALTLLGTITGGSGSTVSLSAIENVNLGTLNFPLSTVNVTSTQGAIIDGNDPPTGTNNITAGTVNLSAARGIGSGPGVNNPIEITASILSAVNTISGDVQIVNLGGNLSVSGSNAGGGAFAITAQGAGSVITVTPAKINTSGGNGPVILTADDIDLTTVGATINAGIGSVTFQPVSNPRPIDLGSAPGTLSLTDAELDRVTAGTVRVGNATNTGGITISQVISASTYSTLSLRTAGSIVQNAAASVSGLTGLALQGATGINLPATANDTANVAAVATAPGAAVTYFDANSVSIGTVDGLSGVLANAAPIDVETFGGVLTVTDTSLANDVNSTGGDVTLVSRGPGLVVNAGAGIRSGGGKILLQADDMTLSGSANTINAGIGRATLKPYSPGRAIDLGVVGPGGITLGLSAAEVSSVAAGTLQIGDTFSGSINVSAAVSATGAPVLSLQTGGGVAEAAGASLVAGQLAILSANAVTLNQPGNDAATLAGFVGATNQAFTYTDSNGLTIGAVDGLVGITTNNAAITVSTSGDLTINNNVTAGAGAISLAAGAANATLTNNATIANTGGNPVTFIGDKMLLGTGLVTTTGPARVTLQPFSAGQKINLGSTTDAAAATLELSNAELGTITTAGVLQVGNATAGAIAVSAPIAVGAAALTLINNAAITETGEITASALRVSSAGPVTLGGPNSIGVLAASVSGAGNAFTFNNAGALQIGNVDGVSGITTNNGAATVTTNNGNVLINNNVLAGTGIVTLTVGGAENTLTVNPFQVSGGSAILTADEMNIQGVINVGSGAANVVTLLPFSAGRPVNLGPLADPAGSLNLSDAELDQVTAGVLRIGSSLLTPVPGPITILAPITQAGSGYTTLSLFSGGTIASTGAGSIAVTNLAAVGAGGVDLTANPNAVTNLAGGTTAQPFTFVNTGDLFVVSVDKNNGIATAGGPVTLLVNAGGGILTVLAPIAAGNANINLSADDMDLQAAVNAGTQTVALRPTNLPRPITLGSNLLNTLGLIDNELDKVTAGLLRIGTAADTANITLAGQITQTGSGYAALSLVTGGAILDGTVTEQADITGGTLSLALSAVTGIGSANNLNLSVPNLAAINTTTGNVQLTNGVAVTIPATAIDGVIGVTNAAGGGNVSLAVTGALTANGPVAATGGGNVSLTTSGANAAIVINGTVAASGGNGNVTIDASAATSGGSVTINNSLSTPDVSATGNGNITIKGRDAATISPNVVIQATNGTITVQSNANNVSGTSDVSLGGGAQILTTGDILISADPDLNGVGGALTTGAGTILGNGAANLVSLTAAKDLTLPDVRAVTVVNARSTAGSLRDDGVETTILQAPTINLTAALAIGGSTAITAADVTGNTATLKAAIDYDPLGGSLNLTQTGAGGNVQLRRVNSGLSTSSLAGFVPVGAGSQLALIAAGGGLTVDTPLTFPAAGKTNVLLGAEGSGNPVTVNQPIANLGAASPTTLVSAGSSVDVEADVTSAGNLNITSTGANLGDGVFLNANVTGTGSGTTITVDSDQDVNVGTATATVSTGTGAGAITLTAGRATGGTGGVTMASGSVISTAANNSAITIKAGTAAGSGGDITLATVTAGTGPVIVQAFSGSIADANGPGTGNVTGGLITLSADGAAGIDLDITTATPLTAGVIAVTTDDPINLRSDGLMQVGSINAGTGAVNLTVGTGLTTGIVTSLNPNDAIADVTGGIVTITATGPTNGATGQIGSFTTTAQFLEVRAGTINASTNNSRLWISALNGGAVGSINAGTDFAVLKSDGGALVSAAVEGTADVTAARVILRGVNNGSFGSGVANPLEIDATDLDAQATGSGSISVRDTAGGLNILNATTVGSAINVESTGGSLTVQNVLSNSGPVTLNAAGGSLTLTQVNAGAGIATLKAAGTVNGTPGGATDVTALAAAVTAGTGIGTPFALETTIGTLAATTATGPVTVVNSNGGLTIGTVGTVSGVSATGVSGAVSITTTGLATAGPLNVSANVQSSGNVTLTATESIGALAGDNVQLGSTVSVTSAGGAINLRAGDLVVVPLGAVVQATGPVTLSGGFNDDGSGGGVTLLGTAVGSAVSVVGGTGDDTFVIAPAATLATLPIDGQGGADRFTVTPNKATAFNITGGNPIPGGPTGDRLDVNIGSTPSPILTAIFDPLTGYSGAWSFGGGFQPINFDTVETLTPTSSLSVSVSDGSSSAIPGTNVTYTVVVSNNGPSLAIGAGFSLVLPGVLLNPTFTSTGTAGTSGNTTSGTGSPNDSLSIPGGGSVTYTVTGRISPSATGSIAATGTIITPPTAPDLSGVFIHTGSDTDTLTPQADITVTSSVVGNAPAPGGKVTYSVTVKNNGPSDAQGVQFTDTLPANAAFVAVTQASGPGFTLAGPAVGASGTVTGTAGTLAAGASANFLITARVFGQPGTSVNNSATAGSSTPDPVSGNASSPLTTKIGPVAIAQRIITGTGVGGPPIVQVFDATNGALISTLQSADDSFTGGVNVGQGDLTGDRIPDAIVGTGVGGGANVRVFDGATGDLIRSFFAYDPAFRGGVNVAAGDVNGDGVPDIITGVGVGGGANVRVFDGVTGDLIRSFFAYDPAFRGGVLVAAGDVDGDGFADIIAGSGVLGGPNVRVFSGRTGSLLRSFFAYDASFRSGVQVGAGDLNGDGFADILTGSGPGAGSNARVFDGRTGQLTQSFYAFGPTSNGGVSVSSTDADGDGRADIVVGAGVGLPGQVRVLNGVTLAEMELLNAYDPPFAAGVFVG